MEVHRKALAVRRELASRPGANLNSTLDLTRSLYAIGVWQDVDRQATAALASFEEVATLANGLETAGRESDPIRLTLALSLNYISNMYEDSRLGPRNVAKAKDYNARATAIAEKLVEANPGDNESRWLLAACVDSYSYLPDKPAERLVACERSLALTEKLADDNPGVTRYRDTLARAFGNLASNLTAVDKMDDAVAALEQAVTLFQKAADENPASTIYRYNLAYGLNNLADRLGKQGQQLSHQGEMNKALAIHERALRSARRESNSIRARSISRSTSPPVSERSAGCGN